MKKTIEEEFEDVFGVKLYEAISSLDYSNRLIKYIDMDTKLKEYVDNEYEKLEENKKGKNYISQMVENRKSVFYSIFKNNLISKTGKKI